MCAAEPHPIVREALDRCGIVYRVIECDAELADTAAFCEHYGYAPDVSCNAIIAASRTDPVKFACAVVLATTRLDVNKKVCRLLGVKRASFASADQTLELTGMEIGGVTPFGLPPMPVYLDARIMSRDEVVLGGGNRTTKIVLAPGELTKLPDSAVVEDLALVRN